MKIETLKPVVIDLDDTLVQGDLLFMSFKKMLRTNFFLIFFVPCWLVRGRAYLKFQIASRIQFDFAKVPLNSKVIEYIRLKKNEGHPILLMTGATEALATGLANHLGLFDRVFSSSSSLNFKGSKKTAYLLQKYGHQKYIYVGNGSDDLVVWRHCFKAGVVSQSSRLIQKVIDLLGKENVFFL